VRLIKVFGLAMIAALTVMAFVGAVSAQAATESVLCEAEEEVCAKNHVYPEKTKFIAQASEPNFVGTLSEKCEKSTISGLTTSSGGMGSPLKAEMTENTFSGNCTPCSIFNFDFFVLDFSIIPFDFEFLGPQFLPSGCPFGIKCTFSASTASLTAENKGGTVVLIAKNVELKLTEGTSKSFCGEAIKFNATYKVLSPTPAYLSSYELP
jgi:hypothetical protein